MLKNKRIVTFVFYLGLFFGLFIINSNSNQFLTVIDNQLVQYLLHLFKTTIAYIIILYLIYIFKDNDILNLKDKSQINKCLIMILIICLISLNYYYCNYNKGKLYFYNTTYTDSLINHKLSLDVPIDKKILESSNPYDSSNRRFSYILDTSFYKGNFFCYFGLLPNLVLFVPYKLLTGNYMTNAMGCLIYTILGILSTFLLYKEIIKKYFKKIKFRTFILSFVYILFGSKLFWCMHRPNFYELIIIAAYFHITMGLYLVLFNDKENRIREFLGCTLLASAVLCRPTTLLASILIIPKLISKFKKDKFKIISWLPVVVPYFVIGAFTMYINYIRFDSIFEFGISYQLASTNHNIKVSILNDLVGSFYYLFATYDIKIIPLSIQGVVNKFPILTDFAVENIGGGVISTSLLGFIIFFIPYIVKYIQDKKLKLYLILTSCLAIGLIIVSSAFGALVGRYMLDFNYLTYFVVVVVSLYFIEKNNNKILCKIYGFIITISIIINFLLSLSNKY